MVVENNRLVAAFVISIGQFVRSVIMENQRTRNSRRADDVGIHPERNAVVFASSLPREISAWLQDLPTHLIANLGDVGSRADAHGVLTIFSVNFGECHLPAPANHHDERPSVLSRTPNRPLSCSTGGIRPHLRNAHAQAWWEWFVPPSAVR